MKSAIIIVSGLLFLMPCYAMNDSSLKREREAVQEDVEPETKRQKMEKDSELIPILPSLQAEYNTLAKLVIQGNTDSIAALQKCLQQIEDIASQGDQNAQFFVGSIYENGNGVEQNFRYSIWRYSLAANQGHQLPKSGLERLFKKLRAYAKSYAQAQEAMSAFYCQAQIMHSSSLIFNQLHGQASNNVPALCIILTPHTSSYIDAAYCLGNLFQNGWGIEKDNIQALIWYKVAATLGDADAMNALGFMYENGIGVNKNFRKAIKYYGSAADKHLNAAHNNLQVCFSRQTLLPWHAVSKWLGS